MTLIAHAVWSEDGLHVWAEGPHPEGGVSGPFFLDARGLEQWAVRLGLDPSRCSPSVVKLALPARGGTPLPSPALAHALGLPGHDAGGAAIAPCQVATLCLSAEHAEEAIDRIMDAAGDEAGGLIAGADVRFYAQLARFARWLLAQQRFVPMLRQGGDGAARGCWLPWCDDEQTLSKLVPLMGTMPPAARAAVDRFAHRPWAVAEDFLGALVDARCRLWLEEEDFFQAVAERDPAADAHAAWLRGILGRSDRIELPSVPEQELIRGVRRWIGTLEERGTSSAWRLCLRLSEPAESGNDEGEARWPLIFQLQSLQHDDLRLDAADIWLVAGESITVEGRRIDHPRELLLSELGRAAKLYPPLEEALEESEPSELLLPTRKAYQFLRELAPILREQGFGVVVPPWWDSPTARLGARLRIDGDGPDPFSAAGGGGVTSPRLGLQTLVKYRWEIAIGQTSLTIQEFEKLAKRQSPLVLLDGRWVEIRPEDVQAAMRFMSENPGGTMGLGQALRLAYAEDVEKTGIPIVGLEAGGWVAGLMNAESMSVNFQTLSPPAAFHGTLRPYQLRGVSWMDFLERLGLGLCLADDMGLGKTVQLLALLALERERAGQEPVAPTLLVVPMSVVGNWIHETKRFCPSLRVLVHHGLERTAASRLEEEALRHDLVITTYALAHRDREALSKVAWGRVVLDEAQYIKNPVAKQARAVRELNAARRVALTGTPVENRLSELWSIMDFLNPGYLGSAQGFRRTFALPVERDRDPHRTLQLKGLIRPFVLRRLKTDPGVIADLPEKLESKEYCPLTTEQAKLYEACVGRMLARIDQSQGAQRRGQVLATLVKLKQICDHPSLYLKDHPALEGGGDVPGTIERSGKCIRLAEMLKEVVAQGDQALVFSQFRQMGHLLVGMLRRVLDREVLFLHGGTPQKQRSEMVEQFQKRDGRTPVLLVSLRAGGVGLNLTAATHVFHVDRWWNPAVEDQATDRVHRIGQTRAVQVHKFVVRGTLEERIDQMIEQKTDLARSVIGSGEQWLTELSTTELRDVLTLRQEAVMDEELEIERITRSI